jgi:uncharacterized protein
MDEIPEAVISVKVLPKSSRDEIIGMEEGICKVKIKAPPVDGKANKALIKVLAKEFNLPRKSIEIISGWTSRLKRVRISGLTQKDLTSLVSRLTS